ncbi:MAG: metal ABC transporter permease [Anaerolineaceae bacterium]|nr:metal ABC transporter permease [Anaerolineaceae bacterium]
MIDFVTNLLSYDFMRNALLAGVLVSIACGVMGTLVVLNRIVFLSGGIAHAAYGGVGLAFYLGIDPVIGAVVFSLLSSMGMGIVQRKTQQRSDTLIGVMWAVGMALGIIFINLSPGYKADLMSYLFGSILAVSHLDILLMLAVTLLIVILVTVFYKLLLAISFDETFARVRNIPVDALYLMMITLVGLTVVVAMRVVGLIMIIALLTIPAAIASLFVKRMWKIMFLSSGLSMLFTFIGLLLSYTLNLTSGATIILVAGASYLLAFMVRALYRKFRVDVRQETNSIG